MAEEKNNFQKQDVVSKDSNRMVNVNGVRIAYEIHGTGEIPLVMVHGGFESRRTWDWVVPHLADSFRVITYDQRGYGESERPSGQNGIREDVSDLAALIENLGFGPAWAVGQSSGGTIVIRLAGERADLLRGIIVHEPGGFNLLADDPTTAPLIEDFPQLLATVSERLASGDHAVPPNSLSRKGWERAFGPNSHPSSGKT